MGRITMTKPPWEVEHEQIKGLGFSWDMTLYIVGFIVITVCALVYSLGHVIF